MFRNVKDGDRDGGISRVVGRHLFAKIMRDQATPEALIIFHQVAQIMSSLQMLLTTQSGRNSQLMPTKMNVQRWRQRWRNCQSY
jgi:hypothetical protein